MKIILLFFFFAISLIVGIIYWIDYIGPSQTISNETHLPHSPGITPSFIKKSPYSEDAVTLTEIPQPYPGLTWHKITSEPTLPPPYFVFNGKVIVINGGQEWTAQIKASVDEEWGMYTNLAHYYETRFAQIGWNGKATSNGTTLEFRNANGPDGGVRGFVGIKDNYLRVFFYQFFAQPNIAKYTIYSSDVIPIDRLPSLIESTK